MSNQQIDTKDEAGNKTPSPTNNAPESAKYTEAQWSKMRRQMQEQINAANKALRDLQGKHDTLIAEHEGTLADNQAFDKAINEAYDEPKLREAIKDHAKQVAKLTRDRSSFQKEKDEFDGIVSQTANEKLDGMRHRLADEYGVSVDSLMEFSEPDKMEFFAWKNRTTDKTNAAPESTPDKPEPGPEPPVAPAPVLPGIAGGGLGDAQLWQKIGQPGYKPTPDEFKRAKQLRDSSLKGG